MVQKIKITEIDKTLLQKAMFEVIETLSKYPVAYKIMVLHTLLESIPVPYAIEEVKNE